MSAHDPSTLYRRLRRRVVEIRRESSGERWFRADAIQLRLRDRRCRTRRSRPQPLAAWERAKGPHPERDPLWREFTEAALHADGERLADIGDWINKGVPMELFRLTPNERLVVDAYLGGSRDV